MASTEFGMQVLLNNWRPPGPADLFELARRRYLGGQGFDLPGLASELGISRATAYRWAGNADALAGKVLAAVGADNHRRVAGEAQGEGAERILDVMARGLRHLARQDHYRAFLESDPQRALRIVASKDGPVQRATLLATQQLLEEEIRAGRLQLPVDAHTMAYALVRIAETFLYADLIAGEEPDVEKALQIMRLMLGAGRRPSRSSRIAGPVVPSRREAPYRGKRRIEGSR